jgi:uncharacterized protein (TIGR03067 family)
MQKTKFLALAVVATVAAVGYTAPGADDRRGAYKEELAKLAGTWQLVSEEKDGQSSPQDRVKGLTLVITGDHYELRMDGKTIDQGTFYIDPARKPKVIDAYPAEGKVLKGIYEIGEDDTMRACFTHPGSDGVRPTEFSTTKGTGHVLHVCKRVKAK